jgi:methylated-DNA-[protein]-cysteine S-methyltransferase
MKFIYDTFSTLAGDFSIALDENGAVAATAFGGLDALRQQLRKSKPELTRDTAGLREARGQVQAYFAGTLRKFTLPLAPEGTAFQKSVWSELKRIPFGKKRSYGEIAAELGNPKASRAVGRANGTNPICLIVPCHRVIGTDGSLTGFFYGKEIKSRLLEHEGIPFKI